MSGPSAAHQQLVQWIARKMAVDGFAVRGVDGPLGDGQLWRLPRVPNTSGIRADVVGNRNDGAVAFGEAKTPDDILSSHTLRQLKQLGCWLVGGLASHLYLAVPWSAARDLDRALARVGLLGARRVRRIHVPDVLLGERDD